MFLRFSIACVIAALPLVAVAEAFGEWEYRESAGDAPIRQALIVVDRHVAGSFGAIVVRCDVAGLSVFVDVGAPLVMRRPVAVRFQFDARAIESTRWHPAPDGVGTFAPDPLPFAEDLAQLYHLTFSAMDADGERHTAEFPLLGSAAAIRPVLVACVDRR